MSERDVLERASQALRTAHDGAGADAALTRARVLMSTHRKRRRRLLGWVFWPPLCTLALAGSAWAESAGKWAPLWHAVAGVIGLEVTAAERTEPSPRPISQGASPTPAQATQLPPPPVLDSKVAAAPAPSEPREATAAPAARRLRAQPETPEAVRPSRREDRAGPAPAAAAAPRAEIPPDPELQAFRAAHELHLRGRDPRAAVDAYAAYLAAFPNGRFVPEARFAAALDQLALGDEEAARSWLAPFASGRYGGYRQEEAARLLEALR